MSIDILILTKLIRSVASVYRDLYTVCIWAAREQKLLACSVMIAKLLKFLVQQ